MSCAAPLRAPKWYKRPAGVSFGFGGKLVSFHTKSFTGGSEVGSVGVLSLMLYLLDLNLFFPFSSRFMCIT